MGVSAHHVEGTLGQVIELASKDFLDKISIAKISWIQSRYLKEFIQYNQF